MFLKTSTIFIDTFWSTISQVWTIKMNCRIVCFQEARNMRQKRDVFSFFNSQKSILSNLNHSSMSPWLRWGLYTVRWGTWHEALSYVCTGLNPGYDHTKPNRAGLWSHLVATTSYTHLTFSSNQPTIFCVIPNHFVTDYYTEKTTGNT